MMRLRAGRPAKRVAPIDWGSVHERLARMASGAAALERGPDQAEALLAERARMLASPLSAQASEQVDLSAVVASIAGERYAIETALVRRVMSLPLLTRLPGVPEIVLGLANLYGEVLPVFDPRRLLGLRVAGSLTSTHILVLGRERVDFGLAVDGVHEVTALRYEQLLPAPESIEPEARPLLRGVRADGLILLDGATLLTDARLVIARSEPA